MKQGHFLKKTYVLKSLKQIKYLLYKNKKNVLERNLLAFNALL